MRAGKFPGGRVEAADADAIATALRETREEIGVGAESCGRSDISTVWKRSAASGSHRSSPGSMAGYSAQPDPGEVAHVFEVPLDFFRAAGNLRQLHLSFRGRPPRSFLNSATPASASGRDSGYAAEPGKAPRGRG